MKTYIVGEDQSTPGRFAVLMLNHYQDEVENATIIDQNLDQEVAKAQVHELNIQSLADHLFSSHPLSESNSYKVEAIKELAKPLAEHILRYVPGPDGSAALRYLRVVVMTAAAGIALDGIA